MSMDSPMPGSVYSHIKKLVGKLQVQAKNKEEKQHRGIRHRGGERGKHKGKTYPRKLQDFRLENPLGRESNYT